MADAGEATAVNGRRSTVSLVVVLVVIALLVGGIGLLVEGLLWLLAIAAVLVVAAVVLGVVGARKVKDRL